MELALKSGQTHRGNQLEPQFSNVSARIFVELVRTQTIGPVPWGMEAGPKLCMSHRVPGVADVADLEISPENHAAEFSLRVSAVAHCFRGVRVSIPY